MSAELRFDLTDPQLKRDPYPIFKALRDAEPMHFSPLGFWIATRYEDVRAILPQPMAHRLIPAGDAARGAPEQVRAMLEAVPLP